MSVNKYLLIAALPKRKKGRNMNLIDTFVHVVTAFCNETKLIKWSEKADYVKIDIEKQ